MGIVRNLFRRQQPERRSSALAMPLFPHTSPPDIAAALRWVQERFADIPPVGPLVGSENTYTVAIPGGQIGLTHIHAPVPRGDLEGPIALAWHWPAASSTIADHVAHEICFASSSELDLIALRLLHSLVIAGIVATNNSSAVYVGSALLVKEASSYVAEMEEANAENLPLLCWLGFNAVAHGFTLSAYTTGLSDFDLLELEIHNSRLEWSELCDFLANVAHYELASGAQIGDGETVGGSESERIVVRHLKSRFMADRKVACIGA